MKVSDAIKGPAIANKIGIITREGYDAKFIYRIDQSDIIMSVFVATKLKYDGYSAIHTMIAGDVYICTTDEISDDDMVRYRLTQDWFLNPNFEII